MSKQKPLERCRMVFVGRDSKTSLELTYNVIALLETYLNANKKLQALTLWKSTAPTYAVAL